MKILVISDIHSNLFAFNAVLADAGEYDSVIFAGDAVGFGPCPNEVIEKLVELKAVCVKGNHDYAISMEDYVRYGEVLAYASHLNRLMLTEKHITWLKELPQNQSITLEGIKFSVYHANPQNPLRGYIQKEDAEEIFNDLIKPTGADVLILGHTHRPYIVKRDKLMIINPGSVGLPRDERRSSYMIIDIDNGGISVTHRRLDYEYRKMGELMLEKGFPERLTERFME